MTSIQQRAALQRQIWQIANDVRGAVDGWDFKQYVLGTLFYRFIDASGLFKKETNNNVLLDAHIEQIMRVFDSKADVEHFAQSVPFEQVAANDYNLSVSSYFEAKDNREVVDIAQINAELKTTVAEIEGAEQGDVA